MKKYSQNDEDLILANYFGDFKGNLLSVGENDGRTLSNSLRLIENGWSAVLFEPSEEAFSRLQALHKDNDKVLCFKYGLAGQTGTFEFYESGSHLKNGDVSLLSTLVEAETEKWEDVGEEFTKKSIECLSFNDAVGAIKEKGESIKFDFITIDAEAVDVIILKQIDLSNVSALCIEYNKDEAVKAEIMEYCAKFGMNTIIYQSYENLVIAKSATFKVEPVSEVTQTVQDEVREKVLSELVNSEVEVGKEEKAFDELKLTLQEQKDLYGDDSVEAPKKNSDASKFIENTTTQTSFNIPNSSPKKDKMYEVNWDLVSTNMDFFRILKAINPSFTKEAAERNGISQYLKKM